MFRWIVNLSLQFRFQMLAAAGALILAGIVQSRDARYDILPEFDDPTVEIQTEALGLAADEVESLVTINVEELLAGTPWLKALTSKSVPGLSSVLLVFEPGTDLMRARQVVQERLSLAWALPNVSKPPIMLQPLSAMGRAMIVGLSSKDVSLIDLSVLARWEIKPKLLGVPGVANVAIWGQRERQLQVQVDPARLRAKGVTLDQVVESAGDSLWVSPLSFLEASTLGTGGWIDTPNQRLGIQHIQPISAAGDLGEVAVAESMLRLKDVAKVVEEHPPLIGDAITNRGPGLLLVVERFPNTDPAEVARGVDAALSEMHQGLPGVDIDANIFRSASYVEASTGNIGRMLLLGGALFVVAVFGLLLSWRALLTCLVAIATSFLAAMLVLLLRGAPVNAIVIAGLAVAFASVVDDAIIAADIIDRRLRERGAAGRESVVAIILDACLAIRAPIAYAALIALLAVAPLLVIAGPLGALLAPFAFSYALAIVASMIVGLAVMPAVALTLLRVGPPNGGSPRALMPLQRRYEAALARVLRAPRSGILVAGVVAIAVVAAIPLLNWSLLPTFKESDFQIAWQTAPGTSHPEMLRAITRASDELRAIPGVRSVAAHVGRAVTGDQVVGIESGQIWVGTDQSSDYGAMVAALRETAEGIPGIDATVETYLSGKVGRDLNGRAAPLQVRIAGPNRDLLRAEAGKVAKILSEVVGVTNVRVEDLIDAPHVEIKVNLEAAGRVGLTPGDVRRAAATVFAGLVVGNLFERQKVFEVAVWGAPESRDSLTDVRELLIDSPNGSQVRLAEVADVRIVSTPRAIDRVGVSRFIDVSASVSGRDAASAASEIKDRLAQTPLPFEFHAVLLNDYAEHQAANWRIAAAGVAAAICAFFLLQACFQSWALASAFLVMLLASLAGGLFGIVISGGSASFGSLAGLLAVLGLAARNGILLIDRCRQLGLQPGAAFGPALVARGAQERFGPIVITALSVALAFLPAAALGAVPGLEIINPMAVVILFGLVTSVLANLFIAPALYLWLGRTAREIEPFGSEQRALS